MTMKIGYWDMVLLAAGYERSLTARETPEMKNMEVVKILVKSDESEMTDAA
jgi:hypothetical protein